MAPAGKGRLVAEARLLTLCTAPDREYGPGTLPAVPAQAACSTASWEDREKFALRRCYGEKRDRNGSAGLWGLPGSAPHQEEGTRVGRERREGPAPAQRAAEGWGPVGKAGLVLPAAPCPAAPGITSSDGRSEGVV